MPEKVSDVFPSIIKRIKEDNEKKLILLGNLTIYEFLLYAVVAYIFFFVEYVGFYLFSIYLGSSYGIIKGVILGLFLYLLYKWL